LTELHVIINLENPKTPLQNQSVYS